MLQGYLCLVLHAHLPFVRHPEHEQFLEEDWLFESITETYLPLLALLDRLAAEGVPFGLTLSISPTLAAMLSDPLLQQRYLRHLDKLIELSAQEIKRTQWTPQLQRLAQRYHEEFCRCRGRFVEEYGCDLLRGFRRLFDSGRIDLITTAATHGYLPLMTNAKARWAQIETGCREFARHFGRRPRGMWLPECGYAFGLDRQLRDAGIEYFFLETHGLLFAEPRPAWGVYAPVQCPQSGLLAFGRDASSSAQVWSAVEGYPGDSHYREFYRDIAFDLDYHYLQPYLHGGARTPTGIKYHRITGPTERKEIYDPEAARHRALEHARDFLRHRLRQVQWLAERMGGRLPVVVAPYDAELFGHWWYEGPIWLENLLRELARQPHVAARSVAECLDHLPQAQVCQPADSSWGSGGYHGVWLDRSNDWVYPHLHSCAEELGELARRHPRAEGVLARALRQAARELLLAQSSDWAFIMSRNTVVDYAVGRVKTHLGNFYHLAGQIANQSLDESALADMESRHNCFPEIDVSLYA